MANSIINNENVISFSTNHKIPYGNQVTVVQMNNNQPRQSWAAIHSHDSFSKIQIEGDTIKSGSFIVIKCQSIGFENFRHSAIDSSSLDQFSENIENQVIAELSR